jgi:signal recognition particle receptor subunit beta
VAHIFLSYGREDIEIMHRVRDSLQTEGLDVWTDESLTPGTQSWQQEIEHAIERSLCTVVILTPNSKQSRWVREELNYAELQDVRIFPILARGTERTSIPFGFITAQRVDIRRDNDYSAELQKLIFTIRIHRVDLEAAAQEPTPLPEAQPEPEPLPSLKTTHSSTPYFPTEVNKAIIVLQNRESKWWRRVDAITRLGELRDPIALPVLEAFLEDKDIDVQRAAQRAIDRIHLPKVDDTLETARIEDTQPSRPQPKKDERAASMRLIITGPTDHLRTEFMRAISEIELISTEREIQPTHVQREWGYPPTQVAMHFGRISLDDNLSMFLFGTPVHQRFDYIWQTLAEGALGFIVVIDSTQLHTFREAHQILEAFTEYAALPYVIAAENYDHPDSWDIADIRIALDLNEHVKIIPFHTHDPESARNVLLELSYLILEDTDS